MNEDKYLIVKGIAGLGNRILSALTGILYARLTGRRLIIDWSDHVYTNDGSNVFHSFFQSPLVSIDTEIPVTDSISPKIWRGRLNESVEVLSKPYGNSQEFRQMSSIDLTKLDYPEDVLVMWTYIDRVDLLRNHFKEALKEFDQASRKDILRKLLREDLILNPQIRERVEQFKSNYLCRKTVGIHVRFTDHRARLKSILNKLSILMRMEPELQIFVATDNLMVKKLFEEKYQGVINTQHWYPTPGSRIHENPGCPDRLENGIEALVDLYVLAECDYLIIDTSSMFSYLAALLTRAPDSNIFNVNHLERGGKGYTMTKRIIWRLMLSLGVFSWGFSLLSKLERTRKPSER
jgi:hypothetical protein